MALPIPANALAVAYRSGNSPPNAPDVDLGQVVINDKFNHIEHGEDMTFNVRFTHVMYTEFDADVRDGRSDDYTAIANADKVYVPNAFGQEFDVVFVERIRNAAFSVRRVYLMRKEWDPVSCGGTLFPIQLDGDTVSTGSCTPTTLPSSLFGTIDDGAVTITTFRLNYNASSGLWEPSADTPEEITSFGCVTATWTLGAIEGSPTFTSNTGADSIISTSPFQALFQSLDFREGETAEEFADVNIYEVS